MVCSINILGHTLSYTISDNIVHIYCDDGFYALMETFPRKGTELLCIALQRDFKKRNGRAIKASQRSLAIEIWGHYFFELLFNKLKWLLNNSVMMSIKERLETATDIIDCGEGDHDSNRWIWDSLVPFYAVIKSMIVDKR